jgi:hypothetical protein
VTLQAHAIQEALISLLGSLAGLILTVALLAGWLSPTPLNIASVAALVIASTAERWL